MIAIPWCSRSKTSYTRNTNGHSYIRNLCCISVASPENSVAFLLQILRQDLCLLISKEILLSEAVIDKGPDWEEEALPTVSRTDVAALPHLTLFLLACRIQAVFPLVTQAERIFLDSASPDCSEATSPTSADLPGRTDPPP